LDEIRVVRGARDADQHAPGLGLEGDGRAAIAGEAVQRDALRTGADGQVQVVALDRRALELVEGRVENCGQVRVRSGEEVVLGGFEPGAGANLGRIADDVSRQAV